MVQKDFVVIFQQVAKEFGLKVNQEEVRDILAILEETLLRTGSLLEKDETLIIGRFIQLMKVDSKPKTGIIQKGDYKGKRFVSPRAEYVDFRATESFKKRLREKQGDVIVLDE